MLEVTGLRSCLLAIVLTLLALYASAQSVGPPPAASLAGIDWSKAEHVTAIMDDYEFMPDRLIFHHDVPTRLHLVNRSGSIHDFTAPHFFKTVDLRDPGVIGASGIGIPVAPHQQKDVDLVPRLRGHFGLICTDHGWAGMTANIFIE